MGKWQGRIDKFMHLKQAVDTDKKILQVKVAVLQKIGSSEM